MIGRSFPRAALASALALSFLAGCGSQPVPPKLAALSPTPAERGKMLQIKGTDFQMLPESRKVMINGVETKKIISWNNDTVIAEVPAEAPLAGKVQVTVNGLESNALDLTLRAPPPSLTKVEPEEGPVGTPVVITGVNLGEKGTVTFGGTPAEATKWSDTRIEVVVPKGAAPGPVAVKVGEREANLLPFTLAVPAIKSLRPDAAREGKPVQVVGADFGAKKEAGRVMFGDNEAKVEKWSDKQIDVIVPALPRDKPEVNVKVVVNGVASTSRKFTVPQPPPPGAIEEADQVHDWLDASVDADGYPRFATVSATNGTPALVRWDGLAYERLEITDPSFKSGQFRHLIGFSMDMTTDEKDTCHIVALDFYDSGIVYMKVDAEGKQTVERVLPSGRRDVFGLSIALDPQNNPSVMYFSESAGLKMFTRAKSGWLEQVLDPKGGESADVSPPRLAFDKEGRPHIAHFDAQTTSLVHYVRDAGQWKKTVVDPGPKVGGGLSMVLDATGQPVIAYRDGGAQPALKLATLTAQGPQIQVVDARPGAGWSSSILLDDKGKIHVVHSVATETWAQQVEGGRMVRKQRVSRIATRYLTNESGTWQSKDLPEETKNAARPTLAQNKEGRRLIAWQDPESKGLRFVWVN